MSVSSNIVDPISLSHPRDYLALMKPRLMSLVVFTAAIGATLAPGDLHPVLFCISVFAIALGAGAAGVFNQWYEADMDALMPRTADRPIPAGRILKEDALTFGVFLTFFSVLLLAFAANYLAAFLLFFTIAFYLVVYTIWLKPRTPQNVVIGGVCGALPPLIGWVSVTNAFAIEPVILFLIVFLWQAPHFWALSIFQKEAYQNAKVPILPIVQGERVTCNQILFYSVLMAISVAAPVYLNMFGWLYTVVVAPLTLYFLYAAIKLRMTSSQKDARHLFLFSIFYMFLLFLSMLFDYMVATWV